MLTKEEFDKVAATHADIRMGRGDLTIHTDEMCPEDAIKHREGVLNDMALMMQTQSGRAIIDRLHDNWRREDDTDDGAVEHRHTTLRRYVPSRRWSTNTDPDKQPNGYSRNDGCDVDIHFNPGVKLSGSNTRSDVLLAHEMAHAIGDTSGTTDPGRVTPAENAQDGVVWTDANGRVHDVKRWDHQAVGPRAFPGPAHVQ
jgi:hypothetical protein